MGGFGHATLFGGTEYTSSTTLVVNANVNHIFLDGFGGGGGGMPGTSGSSSTTTTGLGGSGGRGALRYHQTVRVLGGETLAIAIGAGGSGPGGGLDGGATTVVGSVSGLIFEAPGGAGAGAGPGLGSYFSIAGGNTQSWIPGAQGETRTGGPPRYSANVGTQLASSPITFGPFGCLPGDGGTMTMNSAGTLPAYSGLPQFQFTGGAGGTTAGSGTYLSGGGGGGGGAGPLGVGGNGGTGGSHNDSGVGAAGSGLTAAAANTGAGGGGAGGGGSGSGGGGLPGNAGAGGSGWLRICEIYYSPHP